MRKILCLMLVAMMAIGLVACGKLTVDDMVGKYDVLKMKVDGVTYTKDDIDKLNGVFKLEIKKDGYTYLTTGEDTTKAKIDIDKKTMTLGSQVDKFTYKDGNLKIFQGDDNYMYLKKR